MTEYPSVSFGDEPDEVFAQSLAEAGCDASMVEACSCLLRDRMTGPLRALLEGRRREVLAGLHDKQRELECLDRAIESCRPARDAKDAERRGRHE